MHNNELWVPSENLTDFNKAIVGKIIVTKVFVGDKFSKSDDDRILNLINTINNERKR